MRSTHTSRAARAALLLATTLGLAACGTVTTTGAAERNDLTWRSGTERYRDRLFAPEIQASAPVATAFDVVRMLRPEYLRPYASPRLSYGATPATVVYVDGASWGSLDALSMIPSTMIGEIRRLSVTDARMRYGSAIQGAVIDVRLLRRR